MVPANRGGFETSIQKGNHKKGEVQGQTRQHARLLHLLGVEQVSLLFLFFLNTFSLNRFCLLDYLRY